MQSNIVGPEEGNDHYELQQELGSGATATVYRGIHLQSKQIVAIKMMKKFDLKAQKIIKQEITIMKQLKHDNFVNYINHFICNKRWYIVMEYCGKGTLEQYMTNAGRIPEAHCKLFIKCILKALIFLHQQRNIAHRDIKQVNILINDDFILKIADFGYSKLSEINYYQTVVGTLPLMAPEILKEMPYSKKVDVWALGVLLYMMLYNRQPYRPTNFDGGNNLIGWRNIVDRFKLNFDPNVQVSLACKQFIERCLQKNVDKRPTSSQLIQHKWFISEKSISTTRQGIFNILSQKFKNQKDDVIKFLKKMFVGVFEEHFKKMLHKMQLSEEKINKMIEVLQIHKWGNEISQSYLGLVKLKLQELVNRQFLFVIETKSYSIRLTQIKRFNQYLTRIIKLVQIHLQRINNNKTDKLKFKRKIAEFVMKQVEQQLQLTNEEEISELIPFLKNLCNLVIKQYAVSHVSVKWGENISYEKIQSILIHELQTLKLETIITSINEQPSHKEDLRSMWLIENQIKVLPPTKDAEVQNCQAFLQVLNIPSNFSANLNLLLQKEQGSLEWMDSDK